MARNGDIKMKWLKTKRSFARAVHVVQNQACWDTSYIPSTMRLRNLKTQLCFYGLAYRPRGAFRKHSSNWRNLKTASRFRGKENILKTRLFKNDDVTIITWFPCASYPQTNPKWPVIGAFLSSSGAVWTEHIWWVFRIKPLFSNPYGVVCVERAFQSGKSEAVLTVWNFSFLEKHSKHNLYHKDLW